MDKKKHKYEAPAIIIKKIIVEDGFAVSSNIEGFDDGGSITW